MIARIEKDVTFMENTTLRIKNDWNYKSDEKYTKLVRLMCF